MHRGQVKHFLDSDILDAFDVSNVKSLLCAPETPRSLLKLDFQVSAQGPDDFVQVYAVPTMLQVTAASCFNVLYIGNNRMPATTEAAAVICLNKRKPDDSRPNTFTVTCVAESDVALARAIKFLGGRVDQVVIELDIPPDFFHAATSDDTS